MAAPAFRQISSVSGATRNGTVTITKPTGTVNDDIMVCFFYVETDNAVTHPDGWSDAFETVDNNGATYAHRLYVYWKRASGEGADYTFTWTGNVWQEAIIVSYSGCITTGSPIDNSTSGKVESATVDQSGNNPDIFPTLSFSTNVADTELIYFCQTSVSLPATCDPSSGFGEIGQVSEMEIADKDQVSIGATGNVVSTVSGTGSNGMGSTSAIMVALKPPAALTIEQEGFRWRNDDGNESAATWKANQDTDLSAAAESTARLRIILNGTGDPTAKDFLLEGKLSTDSDWVKI